MFQSIKFVRHVIFKVILKENPVKKDDENEEAEKRRNAGFRPLEKKRKPLNFPKATLRFPPSLVKEPFLLVCTFTSNSFHIL